MSSRDFLVWMAERGVLVRCNVSMAFFRNDDTLTMRVVFASKGVDSTNSEPARELQREVEVRVKTEVTP